MKKEKVGIISKELLRDIRKEYNLNQEQFAKRIGVSTVLISMAEIGTRPVSRHLLQKICNKLNIYYTVTFNPKS